MQLNFSKKALRDYSNLPENLKKIVNKQFNFLLKNLNHPSLHAKKYDETQDIWQGRITGDWRFYFKIYHNIYEIITIIKHPKN